MAVSSALHGGVGVEQCRRLHGNVRLIKPSGAPKASQRETLIVLHANLLASEKKERKSLGASPKFLHRNASVLVAASRKRDASDDGGGSGDGIAVAEATRWWQSALETAASLYPLYVTVGGLVACVNPSAFSFFVERRPTSYRLALAFIMLAMGLTIELRDLFNVLMRRPFSVLFGCVAQFTIMPALGVIISKLVGLPPALSVGLILLSSCPGGTASNVVTLIAQGDVPLSVVMTVCTTLGAVICTPILTKILAGAYVPVDAAGLSISTLQVVVLPILLGSYMQSVFPALVKAIIPFAPLLAVLASSLLASSVFSENVVRFDFSSLRASITSGSGHSWGLEVISSEMGLLFISVILLHFGGFLVGYMVASISGFRESQRRAISIEVGMQNSSLGVVLATSHFASKLVVLPPALSAVVMNIMGSSLGLIWRHTHPDDNPEKLVDDSS